jgi:PAS domain S-box-containing protein
MTAAEQFDILVIDDDEVDRMAVKRALRAGGVAREVVEAADAREAEAVLKTRQFDCILLDHRLPDRDGLSVLRSLRRAGVGVPIIVMTGQGSEQLVVDLMKAGASDYLSKSTVSLEHLAASVRGAVRVARAESMAREASDELVKQKRLAETLYRIGGKLAEERDLGKLVQMVTDEATALLRAQFGAFFYNVVNDRGESYMLYTLSGVPREKFEKFPMPRNTAVFAPTFNGEGVVRLDDVTADARYGKNEPYYGKPPGHLPVRSYIAAPVVSRSGEVLGGLFFGHEEVGVFTAEDEQVLAGVAAQASVAIDNARLYDAVKRREQQYRFLAESVPQIMWTAGADGALDYYNQRWTQYTGLSIDASHGWGWKEAMHPEDAGRCEALWREVIADPKRDVFEIEVRLRRASDKSYRWHLGRAVAMRDDAGKIIKWFGTLTDIDDAKAAEEALRISRERMDLVLDASELGMWYCDLPFGELQWNDKCKEHFHLPHDARVMIDDFYRLIHVDDREPTRQAIERAIEQKRPYDIVYRTIGSRGDVKWVRAIGRTFFDDTGKPIRFDGITVDVTEQKERERTLRQAKEAAEAANVAKDQFLAVLSHELRTPLMPVLTMVQSLEMEAGISRDVRDGLAVIRRNVELEARLIDDLLDLTRISKGKLQLNFDTVDLHAAIESAVQICSVELMNKRLQLVVDLCAARHHVRGDAARLQQVFWNLIKNAIKFTPAGGRITIHCFDDPRGSLVVQVRDTGIGIEPHSLGRIFDAFEQADRSVTRQFGGLGLGLAISKALIDLHGGKLTADSAGPGTGATFTLEFLPTAAEAPMQKPEQPATPTLDAETSPDVRILLVDDHPDTNKAMARLLERLGYDVQTADSVQAALSAADQTRFDLLISDIGLPDGSGLELMRELLGRQHAIKGIALSGFGMEEDVKKSKEAGFYEHLTKPINFKRLEAAIKDLTAAR